MSGQCLALQPPANDSIQAMDEDRAAELFGEYLLMELVLDVARSSTDPQGRLAEIFDRITTRARRGGIAADNSSLMLQFRRHAEQFFVLAGRSVTANGK